MLRGTRCVAAPRPGAVLVVSSVSSPLAAAVVGALSATRRVRAVVEVADDTTALLGHENISLAFHRPPRALDWARALSDPVRRAARRGGCAGFKRGACDAEDGRGEVRAAVFVADDAAKQALVLSGLGACLGRGALRVVVVGKAGSALLAEAEAVAAGRGAVVLRCGATFGDVRRALATGCANPPPPLAKPFGRAAARSTADAARDVAFALRCRGGVAPLDEAAVGAYCADDLLESLDDPRTTGVRVLEGPAPSNWPALASEAARSSLGAGVVALCAPRRRLARLFDGLARLLDGLATLLDGAAAPAPAPAPSSDADGEAVVRVGRPWAAHLDELADFRPRRDVLRALAEKCGYARAPTLRPDAVDRVYYDVVAPARHVFSDALGRRLAVHVSRARAAGPGDGPVVALLLALFNEAKRSLRSVDAATELGRDMLAAADAGPRA